MAIVAGLGPVTLRAQLDGIGERELAAIGEAQTVHDATVMTAGAAQLAMRKAQTHVRTFGAARVGGQLGRFG